MSEMGLLPSSCLRLRPRPRPRPHFAAVATILLEEINARPPHSSFLLRLSSRRR